MLRWLDANTCGTQIAHINSGIAPSAALHASASSSLHLHVLLLTLGGSSSTHGISGRPPLNTWSTTCNTSNSGKQHFGRVEAEVSGVEHSCCITHFDKLQQRCLSLCVCVSVVAAAGWLRL
jgi:hypothetical protein